MSAVLVALGEIWKVVPYTLSLAIVILLLGLVLGTALSLIKLKEIRYLVLPFNLWMSYLRGVPMLVHLLIAQAALPKLVTGLCQLFGQDTEVSEVSSLIIVLVCYVLYEGVVESENIRGVIKSFDYGQFEAGLAIGLKPWLVIKRIVIPQILWTALPLFTNAFLKIIRTLSVAFLVGVIEILASTRYTAALTSNYIASYVAAALIYWGICLGVQALLWMGLGKKNY